MIEVFQVIDEKHSYFTKGDYENWILDKNTQNYIVDRVVKYNYQYKKDSKEKLSEDEVYVLETTVDLYNSYVYMQSEYQEYGDKIFKDDNFKQLKKEFENNLKGIKSKLK